MPTPNDVAESRAMALPDAARAEFEGLKRRLGLDAAAALKVVELPDEQQSRPLYTRHPVRLALREVAYRGRALTASDVDMLKLPAEFGAAALKASQEAAEVWVTGDHQRAWELADDYSKQIIDQLPAELRELDYLDHFKPDPLDGLTPDELADRVLQRGATKPEEGRK